MTIKNKKTPKAEKQHEASCMVFVNTNFDRAFETQAEAEQYAKELREVAAAGCEIAIYKRVKLWKSRITWTEE